MRMQTFQPRPVVDFVLAQVGLDRFPTVIVERSPDNGQAGLVVFVLKLHEPGDFFLTAFAPRGPEIEQDDMPFVGGEIDTPLESVNATWGRGFRESTGVRSAGAVAGRTTAIVGTIPIKVWRCICDDLLDSKLPDCERALI